MTADRTGPVLDVERLDAAADAALTGVRLDLGAVRGRAAADVRRARWRRAGTVVAAAAAVALVLALAAGTGVLRRAPQPAVTPSGPGALPQFVYGPPSLLDPVDRAPVARVGLVLAAVLDRPVGLGFEESTSAVLVSADGGQYRRLPGPVQVGAVSVSDDGRVVAWVAGTSADPLHPDPRAEVVRWVHVATGAVGSTGFGYRAALRPQVETTFLSPDGSRLVARVSVPVEPADPTNPGGRTEDTWALDTTTGRAEVLCRACSPDVTWAGGGRMLVSPDDNGRSQVPGVATVPEPGDNGGAPYSEFVVSHRPFVSADGSRRLVVDKVNRSESGPPDTFSLVETSADGSTVTRTPLGTLVDAGLLAWSGRTAWVSVTEQGATSATVTRVTLGPAGAQASVLPYGGSLSASDADRRGRPQVVAIAADVAAGGRTAASPRPDGPPFRARVHLYLVLHEDPVSVLLLLGGIAVLVAGGRRLARRRRARS